MRKRIIINLFFILILPTPLMFSHVFIIEFREELFGYEYSITEFDEMGIPRINYYMKGEYIGWARNQTSIAKAATTHFNKAENQFGKNCINWLILNGDNLYNSTIWRFSFDSTAYNIEPGWASGLAQGEIIQALITAYEITNNNTYITFAELALNAFFINVKSGGVSYIDDDGIWFEEVASNTSKCRPRILNGHIFAIQGIHEYYKFTNSSDAKFLFEAGLKSLKKNLKSYDFRGIWSRYDLTGNLAGEKYHLIHIDLMDYLYNITGDKYYLDWEQKFQSQWESDLKDIYRNLGNPIFLSYQYYLLFVPFLLVLSIVLKSNRESLLDQNKKMYLLLLFCLIVFCFIVYDSFYIFLLRFHRQKDSFYLSNILFNIFK